MTEINCLLNLKGDVVSLQKDFDQLKINLQNYINNQNKEMNELKNRIQKLENKDKQ